MSRPQMEHAYSFEANDEGALGGHRQPQYTPYRDDSPSRNMLSPPAGYQYEPYTPSASNVPTPPLHRQNPFSDSNANLPYAESMHSSTTPGMDNVGERSAGGGIAGIAYGVAGQNERESGLQSSRGMPEPPHYNQAEAQSNTHLPLNAGYAAGAGAAAGSWSSNHHDQAGMPLQHYPAQPVNSDGPYNKRYSSPWDSRVDQNVFDPNDIEDDGDDGLMRPNNRRSMLSLGRSSNNAAAAGAAAGAAAAGGAAYGLTRGGSNNGHTEKDLKAAEARRRKKRVCFIVLGVLVFLAVLAAAIIGGILGSRDHSKDSSSSDGQSAKEDDAKGDLNKNSDEIKKLMGNKDLRKVFPGMDYTPFNAQYPACLSNPPSQNNVTRDMAVLGQLTDVVRLYGTDCNQTDMVLHSMKQLGYDDMKVWLGVWLDGNKTTNARGMNAMYDILDRNGQEKFAGVIIGNEILYRQDLTVTQLADIIADVRSNFTQKKITLPIGVADLGDNWRKDGADFIENVDVVMSNIHPFFAGVTAEQGAGWTWNFWQENDINLTAGKKGKKNVISEVGWPSEGGNDCGASTCKTKTQGSIAGIDEMNTFMGDFVCQSIKNGTEYFWFEAFDEPWKQQFNKGDQNWEDRWGLMTPDRKLKPGLKIPDCGTDADAADKI